MAESALMEVSSPKSEFSSLKEFVVQLISSRTNLKSIVSDNSANLNPNQPASSSNQGHLAKKGKTTTCSSIEDVIEVLLTSIRGVTVARGIVLSKDPLTKVGGFPLGNGFWEVYIQVAIVREETLMRPYGRYRTIGDVDGTSICWPNCCCLVVTAMD
ncbi:uncharacterized protein LOC131250666 [Magnolia sinica]|uniref:uncharacterized protein LOC131250666 n=1 Tax=Magnolia sinica TaxID=86752 RepID=UPI002657AFE4|nr:uncharacterized protein LOC131250666 [Magnolia sinica]